MLDRQAILRLIPHQGAMCLLDRVVTRSPTDVEARATSHLDPANPLRRDGVLPAVAGIEYGLQAGALLGERPGFLASLRNIRQFTDRLDDPELGELIVTAHLLTQQKHGLLLEFIVSAENRRILLEGRAGIGLNG